ncbi:hypothetical protein ACO0K9_02340 [Undibacterium sp. Ji50W]|uniref:hypothetical protein n=1 Tax=Undibacterium sp. Ji50W TaxID=3413041 RepID=UPI003BF23EB7
MKNYLLALCLAFGMIATDNALAVYAPLTGSGAVSRSNLSSSYLNGTTASLVDYSAFAVPANAANPDSTFQGTLTLTNVNTTGSFTEVGTNLQSSYVNPTHLPAFSYQFIQDGTHIFPINRGLLTTSHADWYYILEPGRVWKETGDNGYSRVAIPFSLQENGANCTHNGVLSFLFKSDGSISKVAYQIASETCQYFQFNMWGLATATYTPQTISTAATAITAYEAEVAARMPTKAIAQLAVDFPSAGITVANIGSEQTASYMTVFGVAVDGTNYVGGCNTRYGTYPYCEVLDLPSYSVSKSVAGAIGLMRLEQKYGGVQSTLIIKNQIAKCSGSQWADVTLLNALDMATGNYTSAGYEVDEGSTAALNNFFLVDTYNAKATHACAYTRKVTPGSKWVYHTSDSFLLGTALNTTYKALAGSTKDYYTDMLVEDLWKPLKMSPTTYTTARTIDSVAYPFTGYGLTFHHDDLVKMGEFLNKNNGSINGTAMLDTTLYNEAMQKTSNHGLDAGGVNSKYLHGFWAWNAASTDTGTALCGSAKWIPYMSGFGGIGVVLLPNNMVYYFVSDNKEYGFKQTLIELNKIRTLC